MAEKKSRVPLLVTVLVAVQPLLDVLSFWTQKAGVSSVPTLALRFGLLGVTVLLGFCLSRKKWVYGAAAGGILLLEAGHVWACLSAPGGYANPVPDLTNAVRILQMPLLTLCFITFLRHDPGSFPALQRGLALSLGIILLVEVLSRLTGTDPKTYSDGLGVLGWFTLSNSQSAILSMLVPLCMGWLLAGGKRLRPLFWAASAAGLLALYLLGTRLSYLGIFTASVGIAVSLLLIDWRGEWKTAAILLLAAGLFVVLMPSSTMGYHLQVDSGAQNRRQDKIDQLIGEDREQVDAAVDKLPEPGLDLQEKEDLVEALTPVYEEFVGDFVEIFGAQETMEMFGYSTNIFDFYDVRSKKLLFAQLLMEGSPPSSRVFGLDYSRFVAGDNIYDVENDFHGIYYLCGGAGLAALCLFLLYFFVLIVRALLKDARRYFTIEAASYGVALLICLAHAFYTAGVLRRPNASVYLSVVLAGVYYLVKIKDYQSSGPTSSKSHWL